MIPIIKQCPLELTGGKILFCSSDGRFFNKRGKELKPSYCPNAPSRKSGGWAKYKLMRGYGIQLCHILVCATFHGPRPVDENGRVFECHHLNGNPTDNRAENLIFLSHGDHRRFDGLTNNLLDTKCKIRFVAKWIITGLEILLEIDQWMLYFV